MLSLLDCPYTRWGHVRGGSCSADVRSRVWKHLGGGLSVARTKDHVYGGFRFDGCVRELNRGDSRCAEWSCLGGGVFPKSPPIQLVVDSWRGTREACPRAVSSLTLGTLLVFEPEDDSVRCFGVVVRRLRGMLTNSELLSWFRWLPESTW